jgi:hypothetical protein
MALEEAPKTGISGRFRPEIPVFGGLKPSRREGTGGMIYSANWIF